MSTLDKIGKPVRYNPPVGLLEFMRQVGNPSLINMGAGVPDPALLPQKALMAAFSHANKKYGGSMWAYQTPEGHMGLRGQIAKRLAKRGVRIEAGSIILTSGCTQALKLAISAVAGKGDVVACESPGYYNLLEQIHEAGAKVLPLPIDMNKGLLLAEAEPLLRKYRPKCLVVCSSLSNPTGATLSQIARKELLKLCVKLGIVVIEDDIYAELVNDGAPKPILSHANANDQVIHVTSFCKSASPGLRVGYIVPGKWFEKVARMKCNTDLHSSVVSEAILASFLELGSFDRHLQKLRVLCQQRREIVRDGLARYFPKGTKVSNPQGGFLIWAELPFAVDLKAWAQRSIAAGVSFAQGEAFLTVQASNGCLRLNCVRAKKQDLIKGIRLMADCIR
ncbi:MAG: PLP-dependent aminotransferase family protein [Verrucomicrobiales bacterium]|jgi:DNA-binding transcriptional MocR family regulator|nr:PLP-dependent aminotransferase family protein [Verrucomicrobiales bacterium]